METEKIPIAVIYKQNGKMVIEITPDANMRELRTFLDEYSEVIFATNIEKWFKD